MIHSDRGVQYAMGVFCDPRAGGAGSRLSHARFTGGSRDRLLNIEYSGTVSVHGVGDMEIEHVTFADNILADDALHIVYGRARLSNLTFLRSFADAIDLDYTSAQLQGIRIVEAGNDGVDLMDCKIAIDGIAIRLAADKGISVGEGADLDLSNGVIRESDTGIAIKDASKARIEGCRFERNRVGVDLFMKNWRYGRPGEGEITTTDFIENEVDLKLEEGSVLRLAQELPMRISNAGTITTIERLE